MPADRSNRKKNAQISTNGSNHVNSLKTRELPDYLMSAALGPMDTAAESLTKQGK
jgi:hypothetical protein